MKMLIAYESVFRARKANSGNNCKTTHCLYIMAKEKIWKVGHWLLSQYSRFLPLKLKKGSFPHDCILCIQKRKAFSFPALLAQPEAGTQTPEQGFLFSVFKFCHFSLELKTSLLLLLLSRLSRVRLFVKLWNVVCHAPLTMGFSRQEYWNGLSCPPPGDIPNPGIEPMSLMSPALEGRFFATSTNWEAPKLV